MVNGQVNLAVCATCSDGIRNQDETGVDCGGVCPPYGESCGNGNCNGSENCSNCPGDCGACPPPLVCQQSHDTGCGGLNANGYCPSTHVGRICNDPPGAPVDNCYPSCNCACSGWAWDNQCGTNGCPSNQRFRWRVGCALTDCEGNPDCWHDGSGCEN